MKLLILNFLQKQKNPPEVLDQCKKYPNKTQLLPYGVRVAWKSGYVTRVICTSVDDPPKVFI